MSHVRVVQVKNTNNVMDRLASLVAMTSKAS